MQTSQNVPPLTRFAAVAFLIQMPQVTNQLPIGIDLDPVTTAPYDQLTDRHAEHTNLNVETVKGLAFAPNGDLWAINTHGSQLQRFVGLAPDPAQTFETILNPVSLAYWVDPLDDLSDRVLVVGGGTHALALHDSVTGRILDLIALPSEPADIVIDPDTNRAFIACQGAGLVVQVDLVQFEIDVSYEIPSERPRFLSIDTGSESVPNDSVVFVAPMISGNNTTVIKAAGERERTIDLSLPENSPNGGLPDEDLFCINPNLTSGLVPAVEPVARGIGTHILEHGRNPVTGNYWYLTLNAKNAQDGIDTEPELRGDFIDNVLVITAAPAHGELIEPQSARRFDLDDISPAPGKQYESHRSLSFPYALAFDSDSGRAYIASSTGDLIGVVSPSGKRLNDLRLPAGAIPRDLVLTPGSESHLYVYCWGLNIIEVFSLSGPDIYSRVARLRLGIDPTSRVVSLGRSIWYDAHRSADGRSTCNSCHLAGGTDLLGWPIEDAPVDYKGVMVTQSLLGIEDTFPYHWRGERSIEDFNGAFPGLLGAGKKLGDVELSAFSEFIFSMQGAANPNQNVNRVLDSELLSEIGNAVKGQAVFRDGEALGSAASCQDCHHLPVATSNDVFVDHGGQIGTERNMEVSHLRELTDKEQPKIDAQIEASLLAPNDDGQRARLGFGFLNDGTIPTLLDFIEAFQLSAEQNQNLLAYVNQFDEGISPAAHTGFFFDAASFAARQGPINTILLRQAKPARDWIDVVAFGVYPHPATDELTPVRWVYVADPDANGLAGDAIFEPDHEDFAPVTWAGFKDATQLAGASNVFLGLPPGNGWSFGVDFDGDGLKNGAETLWMTSPYVADQDHDTYPDGYEVLHSPANGGTGDPLTPNPNGVGDTTDPVLESFELDFVSARLAKVNFRASEPVYYEITYGADAGGPTITETTPTPVTSGTIVLQHMDPSFVTVEQEYTLSIKLTDLSGNSITDTSQDTITTSNFLISPLVGETVVGALEFTPNTVEGATTLSAEAKIRVINKADTFPGFDWPNQIVIAQVLLEDMDDEVPGDWIPLELDRLSVPASQVTGFQIAGVDYDEVPGEFLISAPTGSDPGLGAGEALLAFSVSGLQIEQEVMLRVFGIMEMPESYVAGEVPDFPTNQLHFWSMPMTVPELRGIIWEF